MTTSTEADVEQAALAGAKAGGWPIGRTLSAEHSVRGIS